MQRIIRPVKKLYSEDIVYRNFVAKEHRRRHAIHHKATEDELKAEAKEAKEAQSNKTKSFLVNHKISLLILSIIAVVITFVYTRAVLSTMGFIVLLIFASYSTYYKRKLGIPLGGIELVTFGTVITAVAFGPMIGLLFGIASSLGSEVFSQNFGPLTWIYILTMGAAGLFAGYFSNINLIILGVGATIFALAINQLIYLFIGDEEVKSMTLLYIVVNLLFNTIFFTTLGGRILSLLSY